MFRLFSNSLYRWTWRTGAAVATCWFVCVTPLTAQSSAILRLTEAHRETVLTLLRHDAEAQDAAVTAVRGAATSTDAVFDSVEKVQRDLSAGVIDPLGFVRKASTRAVVPDGARYSATCSRALGEPAALFTLGVAANRTMTDAAGAEDGRALLALVDRHARSPAGRAQESAIAFYLRRGFTYAQTRGIHAHLRWRDEKSEPLRVAVYAVNMFADRPGCDALPNGPVIVLSLQAPNALTDIEAEGRTGEAGRARARTALLKRLGLDEDAARELIATVILARTDANQPEVLDALATIEGDGVSIAARRANVAWWRRHETILAPLVDRALFATSR